MTIATQMEVRITNRICQPNLTFAQFVKIGQWIINRQADRQEAARLGVSVKDYKRNLKSLIKKTKNF